MDENKGIKQDKHPTLTRTQQPSPPLQCDDWFTPRLPSHLGVPQGEGHWGEGHWGERHWGEGHWGEGHWGERHLGDCRQLPMCWAAANPHPHPKCFRLPQVLAELAPLGEVFAASQAPKTPAQGGDESPEFVVVGKAQGFVAVGQAPEVVAVVYPWTSPGLAQVAQLADHLQWYLHCEPMYLPSPPAQSSEVLC